MGIFASVDNSLHPKPNDQSNNSNIRNRISVIAVCSKLWISYIVKQNVQVLDTLSRYALIFCLKPLNLANGFRFTEGYYYSMLRISWGDDAHMLKLRFKTVRVNIFVFKYIGFNFVKYIFKIFD